jgi:response regulator NasT
MYDVMYREMKRKKSKPAVRTEEDRQLILEAKQVLMNRRGMVESEAHKYLQKKSMDNGTSMVETSQMVLQMFG